MNELHVIIGTGALAKSVMQALHKRGKTVKMINRTGKRPAEIPASVEVVGGDAYSVDFTRSVTQGADVVYQCAQPEYHRWVAQFPQLQSAIVEGAAVNGAKLIVGENLYMYGDTHGQPMHENLPYAAHTRKGKLRAVMANQLLQAHRDGKVRVAMARGSDFFGPGVFGSALGERTIIPLLQGKSAEATASLDQPHAFTYIRDFGEAMAILGERDEALGQAWHVPNASPCTQRQMLTLFFEEAGLEPIFSVMKKPMLMLGGLFIPPAREMIEMLYQFEKPFLVDSSKFIQAFGNIATPHETAVKETVSWFQEYLKRSGTAALTNKVPLT